MMMMMMMMMITMMMVVAVCAVRALRGHSLSAAGTPWQALLAVCIDPLGDDFRP
jgi:hypothetical protein